MASSLAPEMVGRSCHGAKVGLDTVTVCVAAARTAHVKDSASGCAAAALHAPAWS